MNDVMREGLVLALVGITIVFSVLSIIAVSVALLRRLDEGWGSREAAETQARTQKAPTIDDLTLVLISAAVATILVGRHRIRQVRVLPTTESKSLSWSAQGRAVLHGSHVISRKP